MRLEIAEKTALSPTLWSQGIKSSAHFQALSMLENVPTPTQKMPSAFFAPDLGNTAPARTRRRKFPIRLWDMRRLLWGPGSREAINFYFNLFFLY